MKREMVHQMSSDILVLIEASCHQHTCYHYVLTYSGGLNDKSR